MLNKGGRCIVIKARIYFYLLLFLQTLFNGDIHSCPPTSSGSMGFSPLYGNGLTTTYIYKYSFVSEIGMRHSTTEIQNFTWHLVISSPPVWTPMSVVDATLFWDSLQFSAQP